MWGSREKTGQGWGIPCSSECEFLNWLEASVKIVPDTLKGSSVKFRGDVCLGATVSCRIGISNFQNDHEYELPAASTITCRLHQNPSFELAEAPRYDSLARQRVLVSDSLND